jgi:hypothetical protein
MLYELSTELFSLHTNLLKLVTLKTFGITMNGC